jgi:lysozyme
MNSTEMLEKLKAANGLIIDVFDAVAAIPAATTPVAEPEPEPEPLFPINAEGISLIKFFESGGDFKVGGNPKYLTAYRDAVGIWTIGYGTTSLKDGGHNDGTIKAGMVISPERADELLAKDLKVFSDQVHGFLKQRPLISDNAFAALVSFAFNLGLENLRRSTLLKYVVASNDAVAAGEFHRWVYAGRHKLKGLIRRRWAERLLYEGANWREYLKHSG